MCVGHVTSTDVIPEAIPTNAKLLQYNTLQDDSTEIVPLVKPSEHDHPHLSLYATIKLMMRHVL